MLSSKYLKPIEKKEIWGFDTETDHPYGNMTIAWVTTPTEQHFFNNPKLLAEFFMEAPANVWICGHNVAYDLNTLFPNYNPKRMEWGGSFICAETYENSKTYFVDLFKFIQKKEKEIAESFGVPYIDQHFNSDPDIVKACLSHAETARIVLTKIQDNYLNMGGQLKFTGSSSSFELFIRKYLPYPIFDSMKESKFKDGLTDDNIKTLCYKAYHGGATEIFRRGQFAEVTMLDVVSMYPFQMFTKDMPDVRRWMHSTDPKKFFKILDDYEGVICADFIVPDMLIAPFIYTFDKERNKVVSHTGRYVYQWVTFPEMRYILSLGGKVKKIRECVYFRRETNFFKPFIADMWKYKAVKETKSWAKLNMNGLSGKFGQRNLENSEYIEVEDLEEVNIEELYAYQDTYFKQETIESGELDFNTRSYPVIVAYITAYARIHLHSSMCRLGLENILYCDTDSIAVINKTPEELKETLTIGSDLGNFELQWSGTMELRGLKYYRYMEQNKDKWVYKIKGVPLKYAEEFWKTERVICEIPRKIRSAIRQHKKVNEWFKKPYVSKNIVDKRIFAADGTSQPIKV